MGRPPVETRHKMVQFQDWSSITGLVKVLNPRVRDGAYIILWLENITHLSMVPGQNQS